MEEHHVDRPEVEAWQHVEPTGTNPSIDLNALCIDKTQAAPQPIEKACGQKLKNKEIKIKKRSTNIEDDTFSQILKIFCSSRSVQ